MFFLCRLKLEIVNLMKIHRPTTFRRALAEAKFYEAHKGNKGFKRGGYITVGKTKSLLKTPPGSTTTLPVVRRTLTMEERKEMTAKGLCL